MAVGDKLAATILGAMPKGKNNFLFGLVTGVEPLKIKVEGLPELTENMLIVGSNCRERVAYGDKHSHPTVGETENFVVINPGLKVDDQVFIIQSNDNQKFYLAERLGGDKL